MKLKCYVIDDMPAIIRLVKKYADESLLTTFVGGETDVLKAIDQLLNGKILTDIVFLDIEMPGVSGLDLVEPLSRVAKVILISGHKDFGHEALERGAVGYIYKPFDLSTFQSTVLRIYNSMKVNATLTPVPSAPFYYIPCEGRNNRTKLNADEIWFAETTGNFTTINTTRKEEIICSLNLSQLEELLCAPYFIRISRSIIVNTSKISSYDAMDVRLENGREFAFGINYKQEFIRIIREHGMLY